jgi:hypothetical protein
MRLHASVLLVVAAVILCGCPGRNAAGPRTAEAGPHRAHVEVFFMSQCPYSSQLMQFLPDVIVDMDGKTELELLAVVDKMDDGEFKAMHGSQELFGNVLSLCSTVHAPDDISRAAFMRCMSASITTVPFGWEDCANVASIPVDQVKACTLGTQGEELLAASFDRSEELGVEGSPYVFVDGVPLNVPLSRASLTDAVCCALDPGDRPEACPDSPACYNVPVDVTVITDGRCDGCVENMEETLSMFLLPFPLLEAEIIDYADPGASELLASADAQLLPAYLFHGNVTDSAAYSMIEEHVIESGGYHVIMSEAVGATFDPRQEICTNDIDDTGNGLVDCDDPDCKEKLACRQEVEARLDLFVMSMCPFGTEAMNAAQKVNSHFKGTLDIELHWIITVLDASKFAKMGLPDQCVTFGDRAFCSLHGPEETEEDLHQICAQSMYPADTFFDYIGCMTNTKMELPWSECATAAGMDAGKIESCASSAEGHDMLAEDGRLGDHLEVDASPMYLWNNFVLESVSFTPAAIADKACEMNPTLERCDTIDVLVEEGKPVPPDAKCHE